MYTTIKLYRTIRGPVWKTTSILDLVWKQLGIGDFILNKTSMSSCLTEGWICANGYPWAKQQTTVYEYVCARETAGKGSWLRQKSSMLLMHERLAIKEKGWRGMYSCSDGVACRGEWILYDTRYCMRDSAVLHCWRQGSQPLDSHNRVPMADFGEYFEEIFQWWSGQCDPLNLKNPS